MYVGSRDRKEILEEINRANEGIKGVEVVKFGDHSHVFKLELENFEMATKVLERGLFLFNMRVAPSQMERERFFDVLICFNCYALDSHTSENCPTPGKVVCSGEHSFRDCKSQTKKCVNCGGDHHTMAMKCPQKMKLLRRGRRMIGGRRWRKGQRGRR